jgi:hypothetical protein
MYKTIGIIKLKLSDFGARGHIFGVTSAIESELGKAKSVDLVVGHHNDDETLLRVALRCSCDITGQYTIFAIRSPILNNIYLKCRYFNIIFFSYTQCFLLS